MYNAGTAPSLVFALALALSAGAVTIPSTPAVETFGGDLQFSVEEDRRVSIKYGDSKTVYIDDASETTVDAIKLGFGYVAQRIVHQHTLMHSPLLAHPVASNHRHRLT